MKIYVVENRDVQDGYMSIEDIFNNYQLAIKNSKSIGEPFWHEIAVVEHNIKHITSDVFLYKHMQIQNIRFLIMNMTLLIMQI